MDGGWEVAKSHHMPTASSQRLPVATRKRLQARRLAATGDGGGGDGRYSRSDYRTGESRYGGWTLRRGSLTALHRRRFEMGIYLSAPKTEKASEDGDHLGLLSTLSFLLLSIYFS